jgi:hypothetical protein
MRSRLVRRRRDTCTWLTPIVRANRSWMMSRSRRVGRARSRSAKTVRASADSKPPSTTPSAAPSWASSSPACCSRGTPRCRMCRSSASRTSSGRRLVRAAISATVGVRPRVDVRSSTAEATARPASLTRRVTWTVHVLSRKYRRSSPSMVGRAKVLNDRRRAGSNLLTALARPTSATCTRSSRGSPRRAKRLAQNDASQLSSSTRALRMRMSPVARRRSKRGSSSSQDGRGGRFTTASWR